MRKIQNSLSLLMRSLVVLGFLICMPLMSTPVFCRWLDEHQELVDQYLPSPVRQRPRPPGKILEPSIFTESPVAEADPSPLPVRQTAFALPDPPELSDPPRLLQPPVRPQVVDPIPGLIAQAEQAGGQNVRIERRGLDYFAICEQPIAGDSVYSRTIHAFGTEPAAVLQRLILMLHTPNEASSVIYRAAGETDARFR